MIARIDHNNPEGFASQVINVLLNVIQDGTLLPGTVLPSIPAMARYQGISPKPVQNAYRYLADKKILISRSGQGTRVNPSLDRSNLCLEKPLGKINLQTDHDRRKATFIGMLVPTVESSLHSTIVKMIENKLHQYGYYLILGNYEDHMLKLSKYLNSFNGCKEIKRIVFSPFRVDFSARCLKQLKAMEDKIILLGNKPQHLEVPCVMLDHKKGGQLGAEYLFKMGHRNILFIGGHENNAGADRRREGFLTYFQDKPKCKITVVNGDFMKEKAYLITRRMFRRRRDFSAVFCVNSLTCAGALQALEDLRVSIPAEVSLITFDDMKYPTGIPITAIAQPLAKMAEKVVNLITTEPKERGQSEILMEPRLIVRKSVSAKSIG